MRKELLNRFLNNECNDVELHEVLEWVKTGIVTPKDKSLYFEYWNEIPEDDNIGKDKRFRNLFDKIQEEIDNKESQNKSSSSKIIGLSQKWMSRAAAILLIPVLGFLYYTLAEKKSMEEQITVSIDNILEIISPPGSRTTVQLSDGTFVHLNVGSKLKYPQFFSGERREVILEGEGYFDVAHNPEKPFVVKTADVNVMALGTSFNVLAYSDDDVVETTLVDGEVVLAQLQEDGSVKTIGAMVPGQHVVYNIETGSVVSSKGSVDKYVAWKDGKLVFKDTPISEVAERLSRTFNVDISVVGEAKDYIYTVTLIDETLFQILDLMTIASPIEYKVFQRKKLPDGTYSKQKIRIKKKSCTNNN